MYRFKLTALFCKSSNSPLYLCLRHLCRLNSSFLIAIQPTPFPLNDACFLKSNWIIVGSKDIPQLRSKQITKNLLLKTIIMDYFNVSCNFQISIKLVRTHFKYDT